MTTDNFEKVMGPIREDFQRDLDAMEGMGFKVARDSAAQDKLIRLVDALWKERVAAEKTFYSSSGELKLDWIELSDATDALLAELAKENEDAEK